MHFFIILNVLFCQSYSVLLLFIAFAQSIQYARGKFAPLSRHPTYAFVIFPFTDAFYARPPKDHILAPISHCNFSLSPSLTPHA